MKKAKVDVIIPVYNEEKVLKDSITSLRAFLLKSLYFLDWRIMIADNGSTDNTGKVAAGLASRYKQVFYKKIDRKGRGYALRKTWLGSNADILSYMDVDLSTHLEAFPIIITALLNGFDVAIGSRLMRGSTVKRSFKREVLSRGYNLLVKLILKTRFSDAQCGFKAITRKVAHKLVPLIKDNEWFFDTELLVLAEKKKYRIFEMPVGWIEDTDTKVQITKTSKNYIESLFRLRKQIKKEKKIKNEIPNMLRDLLRFKRRLK